MAINNNILSLIPTKSLDEIIKLISFPGMEERVRTDAEINQLQLGIRASTRNLSNFSLTCHLIKNECTGELGKIRAIYLRVLIQKYPPGGLNMFILYHSPAKRPDQDVNIQRITYDDDQAKVRDRLALDMLDPTLFLLEGDQILFESEYSSDTDS